jgi:ubiquinol-cytochrome c reductase cytochrome b subunit
VIGEQLALWIRGDFVVADATLNRFFAFHVIALPIVLLGLVVAHIIALHEVGSNNPDGVEIKKLKNKEGKPLDGIPFHPYYTVKDIVGVIVFLFIFSLVLFYMPEMGGWFLEHANFIPADPLKTPEHIAPVWYFTPFYAILRAVPSITASAVPGVVAMGLSIVFLFLLPWLDRSPVKSIRYRGPYFKIALTLFIISFLVLGFLGTQPATELYTLIAQISSVIYFAFFIFMPFYTKFDKDKPVPERVTS